MSRSNATRETWVTEPTIEPKDPVFPADCLMVLAGVSGSGETPGESEAQVRLNLSGRWRAIR